MADINDTKGAPPRDVHLGPPHKNTNWLAWLLLLLGILALLFFLARAFGHRDATPADTGGNAMMADTAPATTLAASTAAPAAYSAAGFGKYLASTEPLPRSFALDKPNFDTSKADIRPEDKGVVTELAGILKRYPTAKVKLTGYADARGTEPVNQQLGQQRADAIKTALVGDGIDGGRIETGSGGDTNPVASNGTAQGQFENRRTEITVTAR